MNNSGENLFEKSFSPRPFSKTFKREEGTEKVQI
jgi:hypothetical protein